MSLRDVLTKKEKYRPKNWLEEVSTQLDKDDFAWLVDCIKNSNEFSGAYIADTMNKFGIPVSASTINNLRKSQAWRAYESI